LSKALAAILVTVVGIGVFVTIDRELGRVHAEAARARQAVVHSRGALLARITQLERFLRRHGLKIPPREQQKGTSHEHLSPNRGAAVYPLGPSPGAPTAPTLHPQRPRHSPSPTPSRKPRPNRT